MTKLVDQFIKHGLNASFHFADDSGGEWSLGYAAQKKALDIFDANPDLQEEMRENADFLWSLNLKRPRDEQEGSA